ncbi:CPBP family intramembrane metalloprotease [Streptomyces actuosus]|uniref:CPBP family intramembrane metalloprotease n=2 Tax=Streptomyces actuosus TaxID=1885 RepID=A0ABS2VUB8_STRAS|nr:CPBP family intramembrane metalloprotease [Streptomyces actuosus]
MALSTGRHRWWRPWVGSGAVLLGMVGLMIVLVVASEAAGIALDRPTDADGMRTWGGTGDTALSLVSIAVAIPVVLLAARWAQGRPAGTVSSVAGRLRWRWLGLCLALAFPLVVVSLGVSVLLPGSSGEDGGAQWVGLPAFLLGLAVVCLCVPFQAAAEEYVFRGWLVQAVGAWCRSPWIAVAPQALLFAAAHGWGTPWGFADLVVFGGTLGVLAVRTGGLEAGIALHLVNNLVGMGIAAAVAGALESDETAADMDWVGAAVDIPMVLLYAAVVLWWARRRRLRATSPAVPGPAAHTVPAYPWPAVPGFPAYGPPAPGTAGAGGGAPLPEPGTEPGSGNTPR